MSNIVRPERPKPPVGRIKRLLAPPLGDIAARVAFSDRSTTWPAEARECLTELSPRLIPTPTIKALAQRLTENLTSDEEKANAILKYVQRELTYKASK